MKKFAILLLSLLTVLFSLSACKTASIFDGKVSELRSILYEGSGETLSLKAAYGFRETPYENDGKVGNLAHTLTLKLLNKETSDVSYTVYLTHDGVDYKSNFKLNPATHSVTAVVEIENFDATEFTVQISTANTSESVTLKSIVPEGTMDYKSALSHLESKQSGLIKNFLDSDGNFNAEIYVRIVVKDSRAFWYVGIASGNEQLKALLIDGANGEVLAIREIF